MEIQKTLLENGDERYADFQRALVPNLPDVKLIGVRVPILRKMSKEFRKTDEYQSFYHELPHEYYDENVLHSILLSDEKDMAQCVKLIDEFLPYVDNWAVCDTLSPKVFKKHHEELLIKVKEWTASDLEYTCRFGIKMLMQHFLEDDFRPEYLDVVAKCSCDAYYINMMVAWYFAEALVKQWDSAYAYIKSGKLPKWVNNKAIQKAKESFRITKDQDLMLADCKQ